MPDPNQSAPPSFYNTMAQQNATGGGAMPPGGAKPPAGGDDAEIMAAVTKVFGAMKKIGAMKDGAQPYIDRIQTALKEMVVDVFKKDPKDLDAAAAPAADSGTPPPPDAGTPPPAGAPA